MRLTPAWEWVSFALGPGGRHSRGLTGVVPQPHQWLEDRIAMLSFQDTTVSDIQQTVRGQMGETSLSLRCFYFGGVSDG